MLSKATKKDMLTHSSEPLFENHLAFMRGHRGELCQVNGGLQLQSAMAGVSWWMPVAQDALIPPGCDCVRLAASSGGQWPDRLTRLGFRCVEELSYMELVDGLLRHMHSVFDVEIVTVADDASADDFASVQTAAFFEDELDEVVEPWRQCFHAMARANYNRADQQFLLGRIEGQPSACMLAVRTPPVSGLYAVGTDPRWRRRGLSTALLARAVADAKCAGASRVILQAVKGSYVEGFYCRLGFVTCFESTVWRLPRVES